MTAADPHLLSWIQCSGKGATHSIDNLAPVSRFREDELRTHMAAMAEICLDRATLSTQASPETAAAIESLMQQPELQAVKQDRNTLQQMMCDLREMVMESPNQYRTTSRPKHDPLDPSGVEPLPHVVAVRPFEQRIYLRARLTICASLVCRQGPPAVVRDDPQLWGRDRDEGM